MIKRLDGGEFNDNSAGDIREMVIDDEHDNPVDATDSQSALNDTRAVTLTLRGQLRTLSSLEEQMVSISRSEREQHNGI